MIDSTVLFDITYGLYIAASVLDGKLCGCVINTAMQQTNEPARVSITVSKQNVTCDAIRQSGRFAVMTMAQDIPMDIIARFGFQSSKDADKFDGVSHSTFDNGMPYLTQYMTAAFSVKVESQLDMGTHILFVGTLQQTQKLATGERLSYAFYRERKNGTTPKNAPSYKPEGEKSGYRCTICGYVYEGEPLPPDFICPICGAPAAAFEKM